MTTPCGASVAPTGGHGCRSSENERCGAAEKKYVRRPSANASDPFSVHFVNIVIFLARGRCCRFAGGS